MDTFEIYTYVYMLCYVCCHVGVFCVGLCVCVCALKYDTCMLFNKGSIEGTKS